MSCPQEIADMIEQLREVEIFLGNIPAKKGWTSKMTSKLAFDNPELVVREEHAEMLFQKIVRTMVADSFSNEQIVIEINSRVFYERGPKYCCIEDILDVTGERPYFRERG